MKKCRLRFLFSQSNSVVSIRSSAVLTGAAVHVRYMSSEVEPCVGWALRVSLPFLAKLIED